MLTVSHTILNKIQTKKANKWLLKFLCDFSSHHDVVVQVSHLIDVHTHLCPVVGHGARIAPLWVTGLRELEIRAVWFPKKKYYMLKE